MEESYHPILPPVGLKTHVLSSSTIVLTWTDTSLGLNQMVPDNRFYTVRYRLESDSSKENSRSVVVCQSYWLYIIQCCLSYCLTVTYVLHINFKKQINVKKNMQSEHAFSTLSALILRLRWILLLVLSLL